MADGINEHHHNPDYLSDALLSQAIVATTSLDEAFSGVDVCVIVTPSGYLRHTARSVRSHVSLQLPLVICSKGAEDGTGALPADVFAEEVGGLERICVLSGPTHAEEVVRRVPSSVVCASVSEDTARMVRDLFSTDAFRTYTSDDLVGVELCGAFKNVIAIAVGVSYGLGMGDNTAATLITRGLAEMSRMVDACGGNVITCMGTWWSRAPRAIRAIAASVRITWRAGALCGSSKRTRTWWWKGRSPARRSLIWPCAITWSFR